MGDLQAWLPHQTGFLPNYNPPPPPPPPPLVAQPLNPLPSEIGEESWRLAERATAGVIENIQATVVSERKRQGVVCYVQKLIRYHLNCEVFPFGSVPLKTYLPDGDIDLTALGLPNAEDALASNVRHVLEMEEQNNDAEFEIKDVKYIHAENYHGYKERHSPGRGKNPVNANHFSRQRNNGQGEGPHDSNLAEKSDHEPPLHLQLPVFSANGRGKTAQLDVSNSPRPSLKETSSANSSVFPPEGELEFGSFDPVWLGAPTTEPGRRLGTISPCTQGSALTIPASTLQRSSMSSNHDRSTQGYQLKDEGDFPPLSG